MDNGYKSNMAHCFCIYELVSERSVLMGDDHALEIASVGTIKIKMFDGSICTIQGVRHVKGLKKNMLSMRQEIEASIA